MYKKLCELEGLMDICTLSNEFSMNFLFAYTLTCVIDLVETIYVYGYR